MKLKIFETSWSGWTRDYEPREKETVHDIELGKKYTIKTANCRSMEGEYVEEVFSFDITDVKENSITVRPHQGFYVDNRTTGESIFDYEKTKEADIVIKLNETVKFSTPTTDAGDIFFLTLIPDTTSKTEASTQETPTAAPSEG